MSQLYGLTPDDRTRVSRTVRAYEDLAQYDLPPEPQLQLGDIGAQFFRLTSVLEWGKQATALRVSALLNDDGSVDWVPYSDELVLVRMGLGQNRIDVGSYVVAVLASYGWLVIGQQLMAQLINGTAVPYGVYSVQHESSAFGETHQGVFPVYHSDTDNDQGEIWEWEFVFGCNIRSGLPTTDLYPGLKTGYFPSSPARLYPVQAHTPAWVAYDSQPDASLPQEVLDNLGWSNATEPQAGQRWGPVEGRFKLSRAATVMPLYWYEWINPGKNQIWRVSAKNITYLPGTGHESTLDKFNLVVSTYTDPDKRTGIVIETTDDDLETTASAATIQSALEALANVGSGNVTVTGAGTAADPWIIEFIGDLALQPVLVGSDKATFTHEHQTSFGPTPTYETVTDEHKANVQITESQEGHSDSYRRFRAPDKWWLLGWSAWGWDSDGAQNWFSPFNFSSSLWGGWGPNWWLGRWGDKPPTSEQLFSDDDTPLPQPPFGELAQHCVYGYVVWSFGWKVVSVDTDNELVYIVGDLGFDNTLIVVNEDLEDCPSYNDPGTDLSGT